MCVCKRACVCVCVSVQVHARVFAPICCKCVHAREQEHSVLELIGATTSSERRAAEKPRRAPLPACPALAPPQAGVRCWKPAARPRASPPACTWPGPGLRPWRHPQPCGAQDHAARWASGGWRVPARPEHLLCTCNHVYSTPPPFPCTRTRTQHAQGHTDAHACTFSCM